VWCFVGVGNHAFADLAPPVFELHIAGRVTRATEEVW
jgi:hypothetical protein